MSDHGARTFEQDDGARRSREFANVSESVVTDRVSTQALKLARVGGEHPGAVLRRALVNELSIETVGVEHHGTGRAGQSFAEPGGSVGPETGTGYHGLAPGVNV